MFKQDYNEHVLINGIPQDERKAPVNLSQLYYFRALTQTHSYQEAAKELFISQPTLSIAISNLEKELGVQLVSRKRHNIELTDEGKQFSRAVNQALQILDENVEALKSQAIEQNTTLRVGIVYSAQDSTWSSVMRSFWMQSRVKPKFTIRQGTTPDLLESLKAGDVDLVIAGTMGEDSSIEQIPCWSQPVCALAQDKNPLVIKYRDKGITLDDLRGYRVLSYISRGPVGPEVQAMVKGHDLDVKYEYTDEITLCSMVMADPDSIALACRSWLIDAFTSIVPLRINDAPTHFHRFYLSHRANIPKTQTLLLEFIEYIKNFDFDSLQDDAKN